RTGIEINLAGRVMEVEHDDHLCRRLEDLERRNEHSERGTRREAVKVGGIFRPIATHKVGPFGCHRLLSGVCAPGYPQDVLESHSFIDLYVAEMRYDLFNFAQRRRLDLPYTGEVWFPVMCPRRGGRKIWFAVPGARGTRIRKVQPLSANRVDPSQCCRASQ